MIYGAGAAMGFTPAQVDAMSPWQFICARAGWERANGLGSPGTGGGGELSDDDLARMGVRGFC